MSQRTVKVGSVVPYGGPRELVMDAAELKRLLVSVKRLTLGQKAEQRAALDAGSHAEEVRSIL